MTALAKQRGLQGLAYIVVENEGLRSPILKFSRKPKRESVEKMNAKLGDIIFWRRDLAGCVQGARRGSG